MLWMYLHELQQDKDEPARLLDMGILSCCSAQQTKCSVRGRLGVLVASESISILSAWEHET